MKKKPQKPRNKPFFCHDENLEFFMLRKECSKDARFTSTVQVMKSQGARDVQIINTCNKKDYHILTHNTSDFQNPSSDIKIGIICVGLRAEYYWIPKFKQLIRQLPHHRSFYFKTILIAETVTIRNRQNGEIRVL